MSEVTTPTSTQTAPVQEQALPPRITQDLVTQCVVLALQEYSNEARQYIVDMVLAHKAMTANLVAYACKSDITESIRSKLTPEEFQFVCANTSLVDQNPVISIHVDLQTLIMASAKISLPRVLGKDIGHSMDGFRGYTKQVFRHVTSFGTVAGEKTGKVGNLQTILSPNLSLSDATMGVTLASPLYLPASHVRGRTASVNPIFRHISTYGLGRTANGENPQKLYCNLLAYMNTVANSTPREQERPLVDFLRELRAKAVADLEGKCTLDDMNSIAASIVSSMPVGTSTKKVLMDAPFLERLIKKTQAPRWGNAEYMKNV